MSTKTDGRLEALSSLVMLEEEARKAENLSELSFIIANDTRRLLPCDQTFLWIFDDIGSARIHRAANLSEIDKNAPSIHWLESLLAWCLTQPWRIESHSISAEILPSELAQRWPEEISGNLLYAPMTIPRFSGGLLLSSENNWTDGHRALMEVLVNAYSHAWHALYRPNRLRSTIAHIKQFRWRYIIAASLLLLYPAKQYVISPAEVVARQPFVVSAPLSGVIRDIHVQPNQLVEQGSLLFEIDDIDLENQLTLAKRSLSITEAEYIRNVHASFECDECRAHAAELLAVMERDRASMQIASQQLERSKVLSPAQGVAVFSDANDWKGRPVRTGERVMLVSDPDSTALLIELPIDDAIAIDTGATVVFYPNISPLLSYRARVYQTSYEANVSANQILAYSLFAEFDEQSPRLGLRGTAKIYGTRAPVLYLILRKPMAWLRRTLAWW
jgi:hypothetical protein